MKNKNNIAYVIYMADLVYDIIFNYTYNNRLFYICKDCKYATNKRSSILIHLKTKKHIDNIIVDNIDEILTDDQIIKIINDKIEFSNNKLLNKCEKKIKSNKILRKRELKQKYKNDIKIKLLNDIYIDDYNRLDFN